MQRIFIIGYPKSGNTWLTRLTARSLNANVGADPRYPEIAADVNHDIKSVCDTIEIYKLHDLPEHLEQKFSPTKDDKIILISRSPLDVFISSFFYFKAPDKAQWIKQNLKQTINPYAIYMRYKYKKKFDDYLHEFINTGLNRIGTLSYFTQTWHDKKTTKNYTISRITYEDLLSDAQAHLERVFKELGLNIPTDNITAAVEEEDFEKRKKAIKQGKKK